MNGSPDTTETLRFGPFELDVRSRELRKGQTRVRLQEQPFEILRMMLERPGLVVTREELCSRLWPNGTFVDFEHSLNAAVKRLRAALGDEADNPRFVETLPRRGYRFIARHDAAMTVAASALAHRVRLAVMPFTVVGDEPGQEYFADGLTEEMIAQLGQLCRGRIGVIARSSSMMFKRSTQRAHEIGQTLRADYLLEGSVRQEGDRVRITARLVETSGETHLWIETYERHLADCLSVQADVAARIARSLAMELMPEQSHGAHATSHDANAYQAYLKARFHWNKPGDEGVDEAIDYYEQSLARDPAFAAAYAGIARARITRAEYYGDLPRRALEMARHSAKRALELEPSLSEAHLALAEIRRTLEWDWRGAESSYSQAIVLNPSHEGAHRSFGAMLATLSRSDEAIREAERACELDPLCLVVNSSAAWVRFVAGDYDKAIARCLHTVEMNPRFSAARACWAPHTSSRDARTLPSSHSRAPWPRRTRTRCCWRGWRTRKRRSAITTPPAASLPGWRGWRSGDSSPRIIWPSHMWGWRTTTRRSRRSNRPPWNATRHCRTSQWTRGSSRSGPTRGMPGSSSCSACSHDNDVDRPRRVVMQHALFAMVVGMLMVSSEIPRPTAPCTDPRPHVAGFVCFA